MKELIKRIKPIVKLYEAIFGPIHVIQKRSKARKASFHSFGEKNKDKVFLVIWNESPVLGPFSFILFKLGVFKYADQKGYIPVMDMKNHYSPMMQDKDKEGLENGWEYSFKQPVDGYSLEEIYDSKRVYLFDKNAFKIPRYDTGMHLLTHKDELKEWHYYFNKYIRLQPALSLRIEHEYAKFKDKKVLGVAVRAAAHWSMLVNNGFFVGHSRVPDCDELIHIVENKMREWGYDTIFFVTEDRYFRNRVKEHFNDVCITVDRPLYRYFEDNGEPNKTEDETSIFREFDNCSISEKNSYYIMEVYLLGRCSALYSTIEGGTICASIINGGEYEKCEFDNHGDLK